MFWRRKKRVAAFVLLGIVIIQLVSCSAEKRDVMIGKCLLKYEICDDNISIITISIFYRLMC